MSFIALLSGAVTQKGAKKEGRRRPVRVTAPVFFVLVISLPLLRHNGAGQLFKLHPAFRVIVLQILGGVCAGHVPAADTAHFHGLPLPHIYTQLFI